MREFMDIMEKGPIYRAGTQHPIHAVLDALRHNPLAPWIRIFGSAAKSPWEKIPDDLDAFVDLNQVELDPQVRKQAVSDLLALAKQHYGTFDPFISMTKRIGTNPQSGKPVFSQVLWTRNAHATGWAVAPKKGPMTAAGRAGTPLEALKTGEPDAAK